jgi:anti-sigma B factor antagonist
MELYHEIRTDAYVVILAGSIDESNAAELNQALHKAIKSQRDKIIVDCHKLAYISTAGIGIFLSNLPHTREKGIQLIFEGLDAKTRKVFHLLGLDALLSLSDTSFAV